MKLELTHLAPYLPYGVEGTIINSKKLLLKKGSRFNVEIDFGVRYILEGDAKLVLRPLSDLTKEIEHNGERFVPLDRLTPYSQGRIDMDMWDKVIPDVPFIDSQKLFEWKFNVFGLPEHLWIDVNALEKNPYS